jgi:hypothetical protein
MTALKFSKKWYVIWPKKVPCGQWTPSVMDYILTKVDAYYRQSKSRRPEITSKFLVADGVSVVLLFDNTEYTLVPETLLIPKHVSSVSA